MSEAHDTGRGPAEATGEVRECTPPSGEAARSEQRLREHIDNAPLAVIELDRQFRITEWTASAERMFGYSSAEVLGKTVDEFRFVYEEDSDLVASDLAGIASGSKVRGMSTNRNYRKDGSVIWCEWYTSAVYDAEGDLESILAAALDVTERKRAEQRAREELDNTRTLLGTAAALASGRSLHDVLDALCGAVLRTLPHSRVTVSLWNDADRAIETAISSGRAPVAPGESIRLDDLTGPGRRIIEERKTMVIDYDVVPPGPAARAGRVPSHVALGVPLVSGDRLVGLLTIDDPRKRRDFSERDVEIAEGISSQAAVAIENARLLEDERERVRLTDALSIVELAIHSSLEWPEIAERALEGAGAAIGAKNGTIIGREQPDWVVWDSFGFKPSAVGLRFHEDEALREFIASTEGRTVALDDVTTVPRLAAVLEHYGVKSMIAAPLVVRGEVVAVFLLAYLEGPHRFTSSEVYFVSRVASGLSLALANSRRYTVERDVSTSLQRAMLTLPDRVEGMEFAHAYHSASDVALVGGDFSDLFELKHGLVGITIGDVAGKGLEASVLTSLVKNAVRAHASEKGAMPAQVLALTGDLVFRSTPSESFVTVFLGVLDPATGAFVYANAGHTTGGVIRDDGRAERLTPTGPILGAFADVVFEQRETTLGHGDLLFLYTDGLTEARRDHDLFGEERVFDLLESRRGAKPRTAVRAMLEAALDFSGGGLKDDMALLAVERLRPGEPAPPRQEIDAT